MEICIVFMLIEAYEILADAAPGYIGLVRYQ